MANIYVRSTDGSNADNGSTWALAKLDGAGAAAIDAAGDTIFFSDNHAESTAGSVTWAIGGTRATPSKLLCGDDAAEPPTSLAATGTVTTTGAGSIFLQGSFFCYGLAFYCGTGGTSAGIYFGNTSGDVQQYEACEFRLVNTGNSTAFIFISANDTNASRLISWKNCDVRFAGASQGIRIEHARFEWCGGSLLSGGTTPTTLFAPSSSGSRACVALVSGVDLSNAGSSMNLVAGAQNRTTKFIFRGCKLPSSWSGSLLAGSISTGTRVELINCSSTDTNYTLRVQDYAGSLVDETTLVKSGGASDGTTPIAWAITTTSEAAYPSQPFVSPEIQAWNETVGSAVTVTVDFLHDSATNLQDDEIWLEVEYLGTSGFPLAVFADDAAADVLATPADQATSAATWTTTGMSNPNEQKLSVTFTPQEKGLIIARVCTAKASYTVYVDPLLVIS